MYNVLLVDDTKFSRKLTKMSLKQFRDAEINVFEADNGVTALAMVEDIDVDIIILDLVMPNVDGFSVLQQLKTHSAFRYIPVIVQSSLADSKIIATALELGAYDYFIKPVGLGEIESAGQNLYLKVRNAIENYSLYKQLSHELKERIRVEKILRASEARYRTIFDQSYDGVALIDITSKKVVEANTRFIQMLGYMDDDINEISIYDFYDDDHDELDTFFEEVLTEQKYLPAEVRSYRRKDGTITYFDRTGSLIRWEDGRLYCLLILRDITAERKHQDELQRDMLIAEKVQQGFLPPDYQNERFEIIGLYYPTHMVSGDLYDYFWDKDKSCLTGYILDVSGHGMATALIGAALKSLFRQTEESNLPLAKRLEWLNSAVMPYCQDVFFAAAFYFKIDFANKTLTYASGGVNHFIVSSGSGGRLEIVPGSLIGVFEGAGYKEHVMPVQPGDFILFFSDGLLNVLPKEFSLPEGADFTGTLDWLDELIVNETNRPDDISVLGVRIK